MRNIMITTECVSDLPEELAEQEEIGIIYYDIRTEQGLFRDTDEVDSDNIMEYMLGGERKASSVVPSREAYQALFREALKTHEELVHICISSGISEAYTNACEAREMFGEACERIHIVDSRHLSSGQGLLVLQAARERSQGKSAKEIARRLCERTSMVHTSFLANNADYLCYNGKVGRPVMKLCQLLHLHPVLGLKDGKLTLQRVYMGSYQRAAKKYISSLFHCEDSVDTGMGFITYAGCNHEVLTRVRQEVEEHIHFDRLWEQKASATISCNCGPLTFGVLFQDKEQ